MMASVRNQPVTGAGAVRDVARGCVAEVLTSLMSILAMEAQGEGQVNVSKDVSGVAKTKETGCALDVLARSRLLALRTLVRIKGRMLAMEVKTALRMWQQAARGCRTLSHALSSHEMQQLVESLAIAQQEPDSKLAEIVRAAFSRHW